jgi:hypothetical protein
MDRTLLLLTALCLASQLHAQPPLHHWPMDESAGTLVHDIAGTSDGLVQNNALWQPGGGQFGGALILNGNDARVVAGPCDITTGSGDAMSLACWFKPVIVSGTERILMAKTIGPDAADFVWSLSLVNNTGARFRVRAAGVVHTLEIPPGSLFSNAWYHLAATYDGTTMRVYLNGSASGSSSAYGTIGYHPQAPVTMGNLVSAQRPFYGGLDDVRIYDRAITAQEVVDLVIGNFATTVPEPGPGLVTLADGALRLPPGNWESLRIMDLQGRLLAERSLRATSILPAPDVGASGIVLIGLQDGARIHTQRVFIP